MRSEARLAAPSAARQPFGVFRRFFVGLIVLIVGVSIGMAWVAIGHHRSAALTQAEADLRSDAYLIRDSEERQGATFGFALPVARAA